VADTLSAIWANAVYSKLILSIVVVLASMVIRRMLHQLLINRLSDDSPHIYVVRKVTGYAVNVLAVLLITGIWLEHVGNLSIVIASQTVAIVRFPSTMPEEQPALTTGRLEKERAL
jgi:hypothetical protein